LLSSNSFAGVNKGKNGFRIAKWETGAIHVGQWKLNEPYGQGKLTHPDGKIEEGFWNNGIVKKN
tara:strand:- start:293 stop:484 length:192 start_codon:yes stop_codon:yes gene_type:complete